MAESDDTSSLALVLWRLDQLDRARANLPTVERVDALDRRISEIETDMSDEQRYRRQITAGVIAALVAPALSLVVALVVLLPSTAGGG